MQYIKKLQVKLVKSKYKNVLKGQIKNPQHLYDIFKDIKDNAQETLIGVYLDDKLQTIAYNILSMGTQSTTIVEPREIFGYGFVIMAKKMILIHNHPKGDPSPSEEDKEVIRELLKSSKIMKMPMLDFVIVGDINSRKKKNYWSLFENIKGEEYSVD